MPTLATICMPAFQHSRTLAHMAARARMRVCAPHMRRRKSAFARTSRPPLCDCDTATPSACLPGAPRPSSRWPSAARRVSRWPSMPSSSTPCSAPRRPNRVRARSPTQLSALNHGHTILHLCACVLSLSHARGDGCLLPRQRGRARTHVGCAEHD